jgi:hypothetical protein
VTKKLGQEGKGLVNSPNYRRENRGDDLMVEVDTKANVGFLLGQFGN